MKIATVNHAFVKYVITIYIKRINGNGYDVNEEFKNLIDAQERFKQLVKEHTTNDCKGALIILSCMTNSKEDFTNMTQIIKLSEAKIEEDYL